MLYASKACALSQRYFYKFVNCSSTNASKYLLFIPNRDYSEDKQGKVDLELPGQEFINAHKIPEKGKIYDKKPFKFECVKGKAYMWCACGCSRTQPFCDGTHKNPKINLNQTIRPVKFVPTEDKEYWFCNCKQTNKRPFCDGTHKRQDIQEAIKS